MDMDISKFQIKEELGKKWTAEAVELALMGRWDEAVQANLRILEIFPDDVRARNRLGKAYSELGRHDEAATAYEQSLQRQPSNSIARKNLAELYPLLNREPDTTLAESTLLSEITDEDELDDEDVKDALSEGSID
jgi:Flp pilus assembly protein TadD